MKLHIKNMVSNRCKLSVEAELDKLGLQYGKIELGEVEIKGELNISTYRTLQVRLIEIGLELISNKREVLIEKIKNSVTEMVHASPSIKKIKHSVYLSDKTHHDYTYLANLFAEETGMTIAHFIICHKIERAKELIMDDELNLTEISYLLNYSSVAHLSTQFKQITGLTASNFKRLPIKTRMALEQL